MALGVVELRSLDEAVAPCQQSDPCHHPCPYSCHHPCADGGIGVAPAPATSVTNRSMTLPVGSSGSSHRWGGLSGSNVELSFHTDGSVYGQIKAERVEP
ncbi:MAG: hypothetical protein FRX49_04485 [Trebouxia sp. A1-2]|nr:MAG: hypothetical protein FRX49_04485 [Trebouxia sp. A1-2]